MSVRLNISEDLLRFYSYSEDTLLLPTTPPVLMAERFPAPFYSKNWLISSRLILFWSNKLVLAGVAPVGGRDLWELSWAYGFFEIAGLGGRPIVCSASASRSACKFTSTAVSSFDYLASCRSLCCPSRPESNYFFDYDDSRCDRITWNWAFPVGYCYP